MKLKMSKEVDLENAPIGKLLLILALPAITSQIINALYNICLLYTSSCYMVSVKCPHLGCELVWNPDEKSWDCPCHGSRFDYKGNVITGPSVYKLDFVKR